MLASLLFMGAIVDQSVAQSCTIGNEDVTGFDNTVDSFAADYLVGTRYQLEADGTLTGVGFVGRNTGAQVQMAVYTDFDNQPGTLIAVSTVGTVGEGLQTFPLTPTALSAGLYWIMAVYDESGPHTHTKTTPEGRICSYKQLPFGSAIPSTGTGFGGYIGTDFSYFMQITCGTLHAEHPDVTAFRCYPNPARETIEIPAIQGLDATRYRITDAAGKTLLSGGWSDGVVKIDVTALASGVYWLQTDDGRWPPIRFCKV